MSISAFSLTFTIVDTKSDVPALFPFASLIMSLSIIRGAYAWTYCVCLRQTIISCKLCTKASHNNFSTLFFVSIFDWQHTIFLIHCSLLSVIQISFDHPFCNHISDHPSTECFQIFSFLFSFDLLNSPVSLFLCS